jgi:hypothetical protein
MKITDFQKNPLALEYAWFSDSLPKVLPFGWVEVKVPPLKGSKAPAVGYHHAMMKMTVVLSGDVESDARRWITATLACTDRAPALDEIITVKNTFIGGEYAAALRVPKRSERAHPYVVHLFRCYDADETTPDFAQATKERARKVATLK